MGLISVILTFFRFVRLLVNLTWVLGKVLWFVLRHTICLPVALVGYGGRRSGRLGTSAPVRIRRDWNDNRIGTVRWSDLENPRWDVISGGEQNHTPQPFIHAYVWCNKVSGNIAHSCVHGPPPHSIKVCLVRKDNSKIVWDRLLALVGSKPKPQFVAGSVPKI